MDDPSKRNGLTSTSMLRMYGDQYTIELFLSGFPCFGNCFYPGSLFLVFLNGRTNGRSLKNKLTTVRVRLYTVRRLLYCTIEPLLSGFPFFALSEWTDGRSIKKKWENSADYTHTNFFTNVTYILYDTHSYTTINQRNSSSSSPRACFNLCFFLSTVPPQNYQCLVLFRMDDP
jgi:hypothetical protein